MGVGYTVTIDCLMVQCTQNSQTKLKLEKDYDITVYKS